MSPTASSLQQSITRLRRTTSGRSLRYPASLRREIVSFALLRRTAGAPVKEIARGLRLPWQTLNRWLERSPRRRLRPVAVVSSPPEPAGPGSPIAIVTPQGFRVEGLDLAAAADLLKRLG